MSVQKKSVDDVLSTSFCFIENIDEYEKRISKTWSNNDNISNLKETLSTKDSEDDGYHEKIDDEEEEEEINESLENLSTATVNESVNESVNEALNETVNEANEISSNEITVNEITVKEITVNELSIKEEETNKEKSSNETNENAYKDIRSPLIQWLYDLSWSVETESLSALQAKSVVNDQETFDALTIRNSQVTIYKIRCESVEIINGIDYLIDKLPIEIEEIETYKSDFQIVCHKICEIIDLCRRKGTDLLCSQNGKKLSQEVSSICQQMIKFINAFNFKETVNNAQLEATLRMLKERFGELINLTIQRECQVISDTLHNTGSELCLKWSLLALWQLTENDAYICRIFTEKYSIIKQLFEIFNRKCYLITKNVCLINQLKAAALRVLSYLCINAKTIRFIYKNINLETELVKHVIKEDNETVLREVSGLLVQLTIPMIDWRDIVKKSERFTQILSKLPFQLLIKLLTNIVSFVQSSEVFLLASAALANISFIEVNALIDYGTIWILMTRGRKLNFIDDIAIRDQIITLIANLSLKNQLEIVKCGALRFLIDSLLITPNAKEDSKSRLHAIERIQQKIATALARLSANSTVIRLIYSFNGIRQLVNLCKCSAARNNSDTVLIACIAALRRIAHNDGKIILKQLNALDLVELEFREVFLRYAKKGESYV